MIDLAYFCGGGWTGGYGAMAAKDLGIDCAQPSISPLRRSHFHTYKPHFLTRKSPASSSARGVIDRFDWINFIVYR
jgi:hypothetical protein